MYIYIPGIQAVYTANWGMDYATDPTELRGTISTTIEPLVDVVFASVPKADLG